MTTLCINKIHQTQKRKDRAIRSNQTRHFSRHFKRETQKETHNIPSVSHSRAQSHKNMGSILGSISSETPPFDLLTTLDKDSEAPCEIRLYSKNIAIQTQQDDSGMNSAFMKLASYIGVRGNPQNSEEKKISMTAPVVSVMSSPEKKMQFILPKELSAPPQPVDPNITITNNPARTLAVLTFSGSWDPDTFIEKRDILLAKLESGEFSKDNVLSKYTPARRSNGELIWESYRYNPPWTLPMLRTNEVAIQLDLK